MNKARIYCLLLCSVFSVALFAQNKAEYFFDNDPGYGRATKVSIDPNAASVTMSTAGLSEGWHIFGLRALGSKAGQTYTHRFLIMGQTQTTALSDVEYFVDTDPGRDKATKLPFTAGQTAFSFDLTNTDDLSEGVHLLGMRAKYGSRWSQTYTHLFFVSKPFEATELTGVEYWLDIDPGQGEATPVEFAAGQSEFALTISNLDELTEGMHLMGVRARYGSRWSQTYTHLFLHTPAHNVPVVVEEVEAYWDNDTENPIVVPFTQEGDTAYITKYDFDMEALAFGPHKLNIHAKVNGVWSILTSYDVCKGAAAMFEFESDPDDVCVGEEILVLNATTDMQDGDIYTWNMGDGTTSTEQDGVFHAYNRAGRYTITLTVESAGCTSVYSQDIYIHSKEAPAVSLSRSKSAVCAGESVTFTANPINGGESPVFTWLRNGQAISGATDAELILDDLTNNETVQVKMTTDNKCATTQTALSDVLTQTVYDLPEIVFSFASTYYKDQGAFQLKNFATPAGGTFYINGTPATLFNPKSNSNPVGTYTIRYVVSNANGCEAEATTTFELKAEHESYVLTVVSADETMGTVAGGGTFTEGSKVTITATALDGYHFVEWQDGNTSASREITLSGDVTYTATFAVNAYTVTFVDEDGTTVIASTEYAYGATPIAPANPSKEATAQYTYTFAGWTPEIAAVTGDATYKATYNRTVNKYTVTFVDEDGTTVIASDEYEYGATPTPPANPSKAETGEYTYTFSGWSPEVSAVSATATYTATYTATHLTVPTELSLSNAGYNTTKNVVLCINFTNDAVVCHDIMLAGNYNQWSTVLSEMYKFAPLAGFDGWYAVEFPFAVTKATNGEDVYPQGKPVELDNEGAFGWDNQCGDPDAWTHKGGNYADITWGIEYEANISYYTAGAYIYEMSYWKKHINPCANIPRHDYTIRLYAPDACEEMKPAVIGDFNNWSEGVAMTEQTDNQGRTFYTATFNDKEGHAYKIREVEAYDWINQLQYKNTDGEWTDFDNLLLGTVEVITLDWSDNSMYRYASCIPPVTYTVTWLDEDGTVLETDAKVNEGTMPEYNGETPTKAADDEFSYTFRGWSPEIVAVTADATYTAQYEATPIPQDETKVATIDLNDATKTSSSNCTVEWTITNNELNVEYTTPSAWKVVGVEFSLPDDIEEIINISFDYYGCGENIVLYPYLRDSENKRWTKSNYFINLQKTEWQSVATYLPDNLLWDNADYAYGERPFAKIGFVANPSTDGSGSFKVRNIQIEYKAKAHDVPTSAEVTGAGISIQKIIRDNNVYILRDGKIYNVTGQEVR